MNAEERRRIAAELHDGAMQELTLARLQLDLLSASASDSVALTVQLQEASTALGHVSERLLELVGALNAPPIVQTSSRP